MKLMVINGSVREGRAADKAQKWAVPILEADPDLELDIVDLKEVDLPFFNEAVIPSAAHGQFENPKATAWAKRVSDADGFLLITPEYNHGPSAVLKNAIDWVYEGWQYKPVGFVSYGGIAAGTRAVQQLKLNLLNVDAFPTRSNVHIPNIGNAFDDSGQPVFKGLDDGLRNLITAIKSMHDRIRR